MSSRKIAAASIGLSAMSIGLLSLTAPSAGASTSPTAWLDLYSAPVGYSVNVYGSGWKANSPASLYFNGVDISNFWTGSKGKLSDNWTVPQQATGQVPVEVVVGTKSYTMQFTVTSGSTSTNTTTTLAPTTTTTTAPSTTTTTTAPATTTSTTVASGTATSSQSAAIPAYWYPDSSNATYTNEVLSGGSHVAFVIADVTSSGAGTSVDSTWYSAIQSYHQAGIKVFGYVDTNSGNRSLSSAETDVSDWYSWYGVDGIFFDVASTSPSLAGPGAYYNLLYNYVKSRTGPGVLGTTVVLNPGTVTDQSYVADSDIICDYEDVEANYASASFPSWTLSYPASHFWNLIYSSAGTTQMQNDVALSKQRNIGYVFVTTLGSSNPWGGMPSGTFWSSELTAIG